MVGHDPIEVLFEDISQVVINFILNNPNYHYVDPVMEFQTSYTKKGYSRHNKESRLRAISCECKPQRVTAACHKWSWLGA